MLPYIISVILAFVSGMLLGIFSLAIVALEMDKKEKTNGDKKES